MNTTELEGIIAARQRTFAGRDERSRSTAAIIPGAGGRG